MSAKRFGGAHSPGGPVETAPKPDDAARKSAQSKGQRPQNKFRGKKASSVDWRAVVMFILPTPLLLAALSAIGSGAAIHMILLLAAYGALMLSAWMTNEGQKAQAAFDEREIAQAPAVPRKLIGAALAGIGVFLGTFIGAGASSLLEFGGQYITSTIFGIAAIGAHLFAFGPDPMKAKGMSGVGAIHAAELERVTSAIDKAEGKLKRIEEMSRKIRDREIEGRVGALNETVRQMIAMVEKDPRDLSRARRYLGVYLQGAEDAMRKYSDGIQHNLDKPEIRDEFLGMLTDLEESFSRGKEKLLIDDRNDLEVEIEVLRDRLGQENI